MKSGSPPLNNQDSMVQNHFLNAKKGGRWRPMGIVPLDPKHPMEKWRVLNPQYMGFFTPQNEGNVGFFMVDDDAKKGKSYSKLDLLRVW